MAAQTYAQMTGADKQLMEQIRNFLAILASGQNADASAFTLPVTSAQAAGTDVTASTTLATNTAGSVTLPGAANKTTYIAGFTVSVLNGTVGPSGLITLTGVISGTMNYHLSGGANGIFISVQFSRPIPASAVNTGIVVNVPAFGATSGAVAVSAHGYQL